MLERVGSALERISLKVVDMKERTLPSYAFDSSRGQFDASALLVEAQNPGLFLWIVDKDIYVEGMNFVFGLADRLQGAILSVYRLPSQEIIEKEAIHEMGHVLGLRHCDNYCVMRFSNSLREVMEKPSCFCEKCRHLIHNKL